MANIRDKRAEQGQVSGPKEESNDAFRICVDVLGISASAAGAQDAIPDLRGVWSGKGKAVVFGNNAHHPGAQKANDAPRVHEIEAAYVVEGQDGRVAWGRSASVVTDTKEPFAWAIAADNKTILGADMDGYFNITLIGPDRMEKCYTEPERIDCCRLL